jgi:outer membrane biosynthesis protein TonB
MTRMRRAFRHLATAALLAAATGLGACENLADMIPDSKKPLPGERKLLFPEGVPGVTQGVPQELLRNSQQLDGQPAQAGIATPPAEPQQVEEAVKPAPKPAPKPKPRVVRRKPPAEPQAAPDTPAAQPQQGSPWPAPQPQQQQPQNSPWPSAPPAGTFTR